MEAAQKTLRQQTASTCRFGSAPVRDAYMHKSRQPSRCGPLIGPLVEALSLRPSRCGPLAEDASCGGTAGACHDGAAVPGDYCLSTQLWR